MTKNNADEKELDFGMLTDLIGYHVRIAQVAIFRDFVAALREYDMTPTQFGTLVVIKQNPGIKQTDLARAIQIDRSTVVPLIDRLENDGLVTRKRLSNDRRTNALKITRDGLQLLEELIPLVRAHEQRMLGRLDKDEQDQLVTIISKIS